MLGTKNITQHFGANEVLQQQKTEASFPGNSFNSFLSMMLNNLLRLKQVNIMPTSAEAMDMAMIGISVTLPREGCSPEKYLIGNKLNPVN